MSDTQERILDATERLFALRGVAATSLRSVTTEAEVNSAAIHYHFGSKEELVSAILTRRIAPLNQERLKRLDQLEAAYPDGPLPPRELVEAFVIPLASIETDGIHSSSIGTLVAWLRVSGEMGGSNCPSKRMEVRDRFAQALCRGRGLSVDEARDRFGFVLGALSGWVRDDLKRTPAEPRRSNHAPLDLRGQLDHLIRFAAAGLDAPAVEENSPDPPKRCAAQGRPE